jgi:hypothetical protein
MCVHAMFIVAAFIRVTHWNNLSVGSIECGVAKQWTITHTKVQSIMLQHE